MGIGRILYAIHGRGRGHATRSRVIIAALRDAGHEVHVLAGPDAESVLADDPFCAPAASLVPGMGVRVLSVLGRRLWGDRRRLVHLRPDVVVSDGDMPSVWAAASRRIPSICVGHGLVFSHGQRPRGISAAPWNREARKARLASWSSTLQVAVNFLAIEPKVNTAVVARPTLRPGLVRADKLRDEVVCYFRDGNGSAVLRALVDAGAHPRLFGRRDPQIPGVRFSLQDDRAFMEALSGARAVVSSAGSQLISECVALGVPQFALYDASDDEQRLNVAMLTQARAGHGSSFRDFSVAAMRDFIGACDAQPVGTCLQDWAAPTASDAVCRGVEQLLNRR